MLVAMSTFRVRTICAACRIVIDTWQARRIHDTSGELVGGMARIGMKIKAKHQGKTGKRKHHLELNFGPDPSTALGKPVDKLRLIDQEKDRYLEHLTDYESDKIIRHCDEPLSKHTGHGSAKP
jgi:hypothetical protein